MSLVSSLSKKVNDLEEERMNSGEEKARLRADNAVLIERVHILEEQLQAAEQRFHHALIISLIIQQLLIIYSKVF
ncbi:unnamed protein product [Onchocerca flexuosa]|uniref:Uncharacterized protein n=1 Tax=Onchocerca flexuosa TaxID=387005 RepID=A0A183HWU1_9BILA|nr:unnamed protein product [Onchocerca flexuosa]